MNSSQIQPLNDRILVKPDEPEKKTASGMILLPDAAQKRTNMGTVIAVGPGKLREDGTRIPLGVKAGDRVIFKQYGVEPIEDTEGGKLMMDEDRVIGLVIYHAKPGDTYPVFTPDTKAEVKPETGVAERAEMKVPQNAATMEQSLQRYEQQFKNRTTK